MKFISEFRNQSLVENLCSEIRSISKKNITLMEVCGGHTMAIQKFGIPNLIPENIKLLSGPGCPVCVTHKGFIDQAVEYSKIQNVIITTFGDLIRVPGSFSTLAKEKSKGADIRIVSSSLKALDIANQNPLKKVIFLGIGFETTAPASAATILEAKKRNILNFYLYSSHKIMPPAMAALINDGVKINGYICPGHVSTITGTHIYEPIVENFGLSCVISGFEPTDILQSILILCKQVEENDPKVEIQYKRAVTEDGNKKAQDIMNEVFETKDDWWRGFGIIPKSGLKLKNAFNQFNAESNFTVDVTTAEEDKGCICGEILKGLKTPLNCGLFAKNCNPENPIGACMVSNEGACQAYFRYNRMNLQS